MNPRGPDGAELPDPKPCRACNNPIVFIEEGFLGRLHPIEWEGGRNHFLSCPDADQFGQPRRPMSYCFKHRHLYNAKAGSCLNCRRVRRAREESDRWRTNPPLEIFGGDQDG